MMDAEMGTTVHKLADLASNNEGTRTWPYAVVLPGARIGGNCDIGAHVLIENDVVIGDRVTIKPGVQLWDGLRVGNDVFIGPNATFTNRPLPQRENFTAKYLETIIEDGASIGAGAVVLPGLILGNGALIGAGAVVTRSVPPRAIVVGNPARVIGYTESKKRDASTVAQTILSGPPGSAREFPSSVRGVTLHKFPFIQDMRGNLSVGEFEQTVPFRPKRYFLVFDVPSAETRGEHAHFHCKQFLICVKGNCSVVADDGRNREEFLLNKPDIGLYLPPMTWGIQYRYSADAMLLVFASEHYEKRDYIRDYAEFLRLAGERK